MILKELFIPELPVLYEWTDIVPGCGDYADDISRAIAAKIDQSEIPNFCTFGTKTLTGFFTKLQRDFLIISLNEFKNYEQYVGVRSYGIHLDIAHFLLVDPGFFTKIMNPSLRGKLTKADILKILDLKSWIQVVSHCINAALEPYREMAKNQNKSSIKKPHFLDIIQ